MTLAAATAAKPVFYPTSDGKPMGETEKHVNAILDTIQGLRFHLRDRPDAYVVGNNFVFWEQGNPKARVSPDVYVVFNVDKTVRDAFFSWQENNNLPSVVFEMTSRSTRGEDMGRKFRLYEQVWRTAEYFQFDPSGDYLRPRLQGYRLGPDGPLRAHRRGAGWSPAQRTVGPGTGRRRPKPALFDPVRARFLPSLGESEEARTEAEAAQAEAEAAQAEARRGPAPLPLVLRQKPLVLRSRQPVLTPKPLVLTMPKPRSPPARRTRTPAKTASRSHWPTNARTDAGPDVFTRRLRARRFAFAPPGETRV
jgi:Uma2 family endonuclease